MTQIVYLPGQDPGRVRYETQRARSLADSRCDAILRVIADEYRDGVTPRELSVRMWRSGRTNTPGTSRLLWRRFGTAAFSSGTTAPRASAYRPKRT